MLVELQLHEDTRHAFFEFVLDEVPAVGDWVQVKHWVNGHDTFRVIRRVFIVKHGRDTVFLTVMPEAVSEATEQVRMESTEQTRMLERCANALRKILIEPNITNFVEAGEAVLALDKKGTP